jgi:hypothetical protein
MVLRSWDFWENIRAEVWRFMILDFRFLIYGIGLDFRKGFEKEGFLEKSEGWGLAV